MKVRKPINLSWLVEKWTLIDEDTYLKNMWLNTESLDFIRINKEIETREDIEQSYIDIDQDVENFILMPGTSEIDNSDIQDAFISSLDRRDRDAFYDNAEFISPSAEFMDTVYELGLEGRWNDFRDKVAAGILLSWGDDEGIPINRDMETLNINKI
ncbi:acyl carrier protein [uncultured Anaerococcus sp.]|uniref:acyl carrier protein n=1 Tax=uncultured Anaerococcus sp. TaxID=293428 RepID=UPI0025ECEFAD|nr:acyl carrier protein [uncultured Anaerococcus sp.]